jgi:hypothetical protein
MTNAFGYSKAYPYSYPSAAYSDKKEFVTEKLACFPNKINLFVSLSLFLFLSLFLSLSQII